VGTGSQNVIPRPRPSLGINRLTGLLALAGNRVLEDFQAKGGRVKGTFSGTITNDGGATTVPLDAGEFDIERE
jgi:hypothetical protein